MWKRQRKGIFLWSSKVSNWSVCLHRTYAGCSNRLNEWNGWKYPELFLLWIKRAGWGIQTEAAYSSFVQKQLYGGWDSGQVASYRTQSVVGVSLRSWMCISYFGLLGMWTPRFLCDVTGSNASRLREFTGVNVEVRVILVAFCLEMWSSIHQLSHQAVILPRSICKVVISSPFLISRNATQSSASRWIGDEPRRGGCCIKHSLFGTSDN